MKITKKQFEKMDVNNMRALQVLKSIDRLLEIDDESVDISVLVEAAIDCLKANDRVFDAAMSDLDLEAVSES